MFLSDAELAEICAPLKSAAAQKRFLRSLGLVVNEKPNGKPLVVRSHAEWVLSGRIGPAAGAPFDPRTQPDREALLKALSERKGYRGKKVD